jgi:hypothetical protein
VSLHHAQTHARTSFSYHDPSPHRVQEDDVGLGIIETPLAMTLSGAADGVAEARIAPASLGETVVVLTNELAPPGLDDVELDDEEP